MLKRYQVLLTDWQEEYIKLLTETYDISFSEALRGEMCLAIIATIPLLCPDYKPQKTTHELMKELKKIMVLPAPEEELFRFISRLYFEARKAVEHRLSHKSCLISSPMSQSRLGKKTKRR